MKLFTWLKNNEGKFPLSTVQTVGVGAAAAVAGLAVWQMFSTPAASSDTAFSVPDDEIVYVANGGGAGVAEAGGRVGVGGERQSAIRATLSKDFTMMELDGTVTKSELDQQDEDIKAFKMDGASEGLHTGPNGMSGSDMPTPGGFDMTALQQQMADLQNSANQKVLEAEAAAGAGGANGANGQGTTGGADGRFGMANGMAHANGNNLNSTPLQAGEGVGGTLGGAEGGEGANVGGNRAEKRLEAATRRAQFDGNREAIIGMAERFRAEDSLKGIEDQTSRGTKTLAKNAETLSSAYMGGEKDNAKAQIEGDETSNLGGGSGSVDFTQPDMGGFNAGVEGAMSEAKMFYDDRDALIGELDKYREDVVDNCFKWYHYLYVGPFNPSYWCAKNRKGSVETRTNMFMETWKNSKYETESSEGPLGKQVQETYKGIYGTLGWTNIGGKNRINNKYNAFADKFAPEDDISKRAYEESKKKTNPHSGSVDHNSGALAHQLRDDRDMDTRLK